MRRRHRFAALAEAAMSMPVDEKSPLLRVREEKHACERPAFLSRALGRHRAAVALALALAFALAVGVARVEWDGRTASHHRRHHRGHREHGGRHQCDDCSFDRSRWTMANDTFPRGRGSCAFVSNDPYLGRLGASIDAHDEVIRLNNFYTRVGDVAHYGHKVTYLVFMLWSEEDFVREFAQVHRCMFRNQLEPAHHNRKTQYTKSELGTKFGCSYVPKAAYTMSMSALAAVRAADDPTRKRHRQKKSILSTGALAVFALAPKCAEVHFYGFTVPSYKTWRHDLNAEHEAMRAAFPRAVWH